MAYFRKRKNGSYELRMKFGKKVDGTPKVYTRTFKPKEGLTEHQILVALDEELEKFERDVKSSTVITGYSTFNEMAEHWLETEGRSHLAPKTLERYKSFAERIKPSIIGKTKLKDIDAQMLNSFYRALAMPGANLLTGERLSPKTIREHHNFISKILNTSWKWGCVPENVAKKADPPTVSEKKLEILDEEEITNVMALLTEESIKMRTAITLLIIGGMRRGELCGLEWKDIDYKNMTMNIARTSQYVDHEIITKSTKTDRERTISIDQYTIDILNEYKAWQNDQKKKAGKFWVETDRLFTKADGTPIHPDSIGDMWYRFQKRHGLKIHSVHSLRHTNVSILIANNFDVATIAARLGHKDSTTTLKIYAHQFKARDEAAAKMLGEIAQSAVKNLEIDA